MALWLVAKVFTIIHDETFCNLHIYFSNALTQLWGIVNAADAEFGSFLRMFWVVICRQSFYRKQCFLNAYMNAIAGDLIVVNLLTGIGKPSSSFPCTYCKATSSHWSTQAPLRTIEGNEQDFRAWERSFGRTCDREKYFSRSALPIFKGWRPYSLQLPTTSTSFEARHCKSAYEFNIFRLPGCWRTLTANIPHYFNCTN